MNVLKRVGQPVTIETRGLSLLERMTCNPLRRRRFSGQWDKLRADRSKEAKTWV